MSVRPAYGGLRSAQWLRSFRYGPVVYAFRNLETGQVLFSQTLHAQQFYIDQQFKWPNWQNRKPALRRDIWRALAAVEVQNHETAVNLYRNLVQLRDRRDKHEKLKARDWRRKSTDGNIWFWNQFRPTYTQEAVADLAAALDALQTPGKIWWENSYRKGPEDAWSEQIEHTVLPRHNPREQPVVLNAIRVESLHRARQHQAERTKTETAAAEAARAQNQPTAAELRRAERKKLALDLRRRREESARRDADYIAQKPELQDLENKLAFVRKAEKAVADAWKSYDHFLPHGQRGPAKAPIKLRERALKQAKRVYRQAKRRVAAQDNKRRVPQPKVRRSL